MPELISCMDLDDTFVVSQRKQKEGLKYEAVGQNAQGDWISFRDPKQAALFRLLKEKGRIIPITGRVSASVARLKLTFSSFRIVSYGALILDASGRIVEDWLEVNQLLAFQQEMQALFRELSLLVGGLPRPVRHEVVIDKGIGVYLSVKGDADLVEKGKALLERENILPAGYLLHHSPFNLAILPPCSRKEKALAWLQEHHLPQDALFLGFGDSHSDLPFMHLCDFACFPPGSQIGKQLTFIPKH